MAGDTGQGQNASFGATSLPNIRSIQTQNTGQVISETVADGVLTQAVGSGWTWVVDFIAPTSASHTLETAIKFGTTGAIDIESGKTKYTSANGRSGGYTKTSPSNGFIGYAVTLTIDGDPTLAAAT